MHLLCNTRGDDMSNVTFTFRVDEGLKTEFANAAKAQDRTGAQLLRDFMRGYVTQQNNNNEYDEWLIQKVEKSRAEANAGNLTPATEVEEYFAKLRLEANKNKVNSE